MLAQKSTDEAGAVENADEYKHQLEDEVTQGALLAMTLQSILNDQSFETNENRYYFKATKCYVKLCEPNEIHVSDEGSSQTVSFLLWIKLPFWCIPMELLNESRIKKYHYDYIIPLQHFQNILKQTKNTFPT